MQQHRWIENITLNVVSQSVVTQRQVLYDFTYIGNQKMNKYNKRGTDLQAHVTKCFLEGRQVIG